MGLLQHIDAEEHIEAPNVHCERPANFEMYQHSTVGARNAILMTNIPLPPRTLQIFPRSLRTRELQPTRRDGRRPMG